MSDIVKRARDMHALAANSCDPAYNRILLEMANEIEWLQWFEERYHLKGEVIAKQDVVIERLQAMVLDTEKRNEVLRAKIDLMRGSAPQMPQVIGEPDWGDGQSPPAIGKGSLEEKT